MFGQHLAALDAAVFTHLSDDRAAIWTRSDGTAIPVAVIVGSGEQTVTIGGIQTIMSGDMARLSAAELRRKTEALGAPGLPLQGETLTVNGVTYVLHGDAFYDEESHGRDVVCSMSR